MSAPPHSSVQELNSRLLEQLMGQSDAQQIAAVRRSVVNSGSSFQNHPQSLPTFQANGSQQALNPLNHHLHFSSSSYFPTVLPQQENFSQSNQIPGQSPQALNLQQFFTQPSGSAAALWATNPLQGIAAQHAPSLANPGFPGIGFLQQSQLLTTPAIPGPYPTAQQQRMVGLPPQPPLPTAQAMREPSAITQQQLQLMQQQLMFLTRQSVPGPSTATLPYTGASTAQGSFQAFPGLLQPDLSKVLQVASSCNHLNNLIYRDHVLNAAIAQSLQNGTSQQLFSSSLPGSSLSSALPQVPMQVAQMQARAASQPSNSTAAEAEAYQNAYHHAPVPPQNETVEVIQHTSEPNDGIDLNPTGLSVKREQLLQWQKEQNQRAIAETLANYRDTATPPGFGPRERPEEPGNFEDYGVLVARILADLDLGNCRFARQENGEVHANEGQVAKANAANLDNMMQEQAQTLAFTSNFGTRSHQSPDSSIYLTDYGALVFEEPSFPTPSSILQESGLLPQLAVANQLNSGLVVPVSEESELFDTQIENRNNGTDVLFARLLNMDTSDLGGLPEDTSLTHSETDGSCPDTSGSTSKTASPNPKKLSPSSSPAVLPGNGEQSTSNDHSELEKEVLMVETHKPQDISVVLITNTALSLAQEFNEKTREEHDEPCSSVPARPTTRRGQGQSCAAHENKAKKTEGDGEPVCERGYKFGLSTLGRKRRWNIKYRPADGEEPPPEYKRYKMWYSKLSEVPIEKEKDVLKKVDTKEKRFGSTRSAVLDDKEEERKRRKEKEAKRRKEEGIDEEDKKIEEEDGEWNEKELGVEVLGTA